MSDLVQYLKGTSANPRVTFQVNGVGTNLDSGLPTITQTRPDGTAGPVSGTVTSLGGGQYSWVIAAQPEVTWLDYAAVGTVGGQPQTLRGRVEWVGALLFTLTAAKAWDGGAIPAAGVSDDAIIDMREQLIDDLERAGRCNVAFVPRFTREVHNAAGANIPLYHRPAGPLLSVTVNGVVKDVAGYTLDRAGILRATSNYGYGAAIQAGIGNLVVEYVRGYAQVPGPVSMAALRITRALLVPSNIGDRATSITNDAGTILLATAGRGQYQPYGLPLADSVLAAYRVPLAA